MAIRRKKPDVRRWLRAQGLRAGKRGPHPNAARWRRILAYLTAHPEVTSEEVAFQFNMRHSALRMLLSRAGVRKRWTLPQAEEGIHAL